MATLKDFWTGKKVLITGASSGLGAALVEALAPYGVHLGLLSRREEPMKALAQRFASSGSQFWIRSVNVQDRLAVEDAVRAFSAAAGGLDVVWVNSGVGSETSWKRWRWNEVDDMLQTNLMGAMYTTHASLSVMVPHEHGTVVGIASAAAMRGLPTRAVYSISKIGLVYYLEALAAELPQIQFCTIYPGYVDTPINQGNPQRMWLMTPERAAVKMMNAVARGRRNYIYPFQMKILFHLVRLLPWGIYRLMVRKMLPPPREG